MKKSTVLKYIAIILLLNPFLALATDIGASNKQYPPYPDIWGYDLSKYQAVKENKNLIFAYKVDNGDYWFEFRNFIKMEDSNDEHNKKVTIEKKLGLLKFFEGTVARLTDQEEKYMSTLSGKSEVWRDSGEKITFSNGHTIEIEYKFNRPKACDGETIREVSFIKKDEKGNELGEYSVIIATPTVSKVEEWTAEGAIDGCGFPSYDGYIYKQLFSLSGKMIKLEDDTFILYKRNYNIIARFDQNFKTKFNPKVNFKTRDGRILKRNLFVIPHKVVNDIYLEVTDKKIPWIQGLHDGLMDYIIKNYNN